MLVRSKLDDKDSQDGSVSADKGADQTTADAGVEASTGDAGVDVGADSQPDAGDTLCDKPPVKLGAAPLPGDSKLAISVDHTDAPSVLVVSTMPTHGVTRYYWDPKSSSIKSHPLQIPGAGATEFRVAAAHDSVGRMHVFVSRIANGSRTVYQAVLAKLPLTNYLLAPRAFTGADFGAAELHAAGGGDTILLATAHAGGRNLVRVTTGGTYAVNVCSLAADASKTSAYAYPRVGSARGAGPLRMALGFYYSQTAPAAASGWEFIAAEGWSGKCPQTIDKQDIPSSKNAAELGPLGVARQGNGDAVIAYADAQSGATPPGGDLIFGIYTGATKKLNTRKIAAPNPHSPMSVSVALSARNRATVVAQAPLPGGPELNLYEEGNPQFSKALIEKAGGPLTAAVVDKKNHLHLVYSAGLMGQQPEVHYVCRTLKP